MSDIKLLNEEINLIARKYGLNLPSENKKTFIDDLRKIELDIQTLREKLAILEFIQLIPQETMSVQEVVIPEISLEKKVELPSSKNESEPEPFEKVLPDESRKEIKPLDKAEDVSSEPTTKKNSEIPSALGDKLRKRGISELSSAIGISEKFLFIQELFNHNTERYLKEIQSLNDSQTKEKVLQKLTALQEEFNWNIEGKAYLELYSLIERKFPE